MKNNYVPTTLNEFLNESKNFVLKRKYGERQPISVGSIAPIRNQVLSYVNENKIISRNDLRKFILGLNEGTIKPAAVSMWMKRNEKYFIAESKNGVTYYKLSDLGKRLANRISPIEKPVLTESRLYESKVAKKNGISPVQVKKIKRIYNKLKKEDYTKEQLYKAVSKECGCSVPEVKKVMADLKESYSYRRGGCGCGHGVKPRRLTEGCTCVEDDHDYDIDDYESRFDPDEEPRRFGRKLELPKRNLRDIDDEDEFEPGQAFDYEDEDNDFQDEDYKPRRHDFTDRRTGKPGLYDEDLEDEAIDEPFEEDDMDESFQRKQRKMKRIVENIRRRRARLLEEESTEEPLEEKKEKKEEVEETPEEPTEETEEKSDDESQEFNENPEDEDEEGKVEITEFVITVDNTEEAIKELEEKEVTAEKVMDDEGNEIEGQIKVNADSWDKLKEWLEEKGVDVKEMFGGDIEVEETEEPVEDETKEEGEESDEDILSFLNDDEDEGEKEEEPEKEEEKE
jgi:hypothetical protein